VRRASACATGATELARSDNRPRAASLRYCNGYAIHPRASGARHRRIARHRPRDRARAGRRRRAGRRHRAAAPRHLSTARNSIEAAGPGGVETLQADVRRYDEVQRAIDATVARFGGLDILVNNAGIGIFVDVASMTPAQWTELIETNSPASSTPATRRCRTCGRAAAASSSTSAASREQPVQGRRRPTARRRPG
jgi:NAD(P)-dependent dehydrogenase (short-subunit alcohol dehydrogenase family)